VQRVLSGSGGCHLDLHADPAEGTLEEAADRAVTLGATVRHREADELICLRGWPTGVPVRLLLQRLDDAAPGQRVRAHVDIGAAVVAGEVARHVGLGARVTGTFGYWTVLADPAGREYCVVARRPTART
jgi:Glyoxalase-like domain